MTFYKMERGWLDSEMFADAAYDERSAWAWMIGEARWADSIVSDRFKRPVLVKRGQLFSSVRFMAEKFGWSKDRVQRFVERLAKWGAITVETATDQNIITICNYDDYQGHKDDPKDGVEDNLKDDSKDDPKDKQEEIQINSKKGKKIITQCPADVSESVWEDFKTHRKIKKAAITDTVIEGFRKEAEKAGISFELALRETQLLGWQGFRADWYLKSKGNGNATTLGSGTNGNRGTGYQKQPTKYDRARAAMRKSEIDLGYADDGHAGQETTN